MSYSVSFIQDYYAASLNLLVFLSRLGVRSVVPKIESTWEIYEYASYMTKRREKQAL